MIEKGKAMKSASLWMITLALAPTIALGQAKQALRKNPVVLPNCMISPLHDVRVPVRVSGVLAELLVKQGDVVKKGQVLARLDDRLAKIEVKARKLAAENESPYMGALARQEEALAGVEDAQKLVRTKAMSDEEFRLKKAQLKVAKFGVDDAEVTQLLAQVDLERARMQLEMHEVVSPIDGIVVQLVRQEGESVQELDPILQVIGADRVKVEGEIDIREASRVRKGMVIDVYPNRTVDEARQFRGHTDEVLAVVALPDGLRCASGGEDGDIFIWNIALGVQDLVLTGSGDAIHCLASHRATPNRLIAGVDDGSLRIHDLDTGKNVQTIKAIGSSVRSLALHPLKPNLCVTGHEDRSIRIWDLKTGGLLGTLAGHANHVTSLDFAPDGKYLLSAGADGTARLWDFEARKQLNVFPGRSSQVHQLSLSSTGKEFLFNTYSFMQARSVPDGSPVGSFESFSGSFTDVAVFAPLPGLVLTAADNTHDLQLWRQGDQDRYPRLVRVYEGHQEEIHAVDFSAAGDFFVSGSADRTVRVWTVPSLKQIDGERRRGVVESIKPQVSGGSQTVAMYAEIDNRDHLLQPGAGATIVVYPDSKPLVARD